jgi:SMC interacting uncharacterized protein involved in chromosome segregation
VDRKTLEYMEDRAKVARKIVNQIEDLKEKAKKVQKADWITFQANQHGHYFEERSCNLLRKMKIEFGNAVVEEIQRLEQELTEL